MTTTTTNALLDLPAALRAAGIKVVELPGWKLRRSGRMRWAGPTGVVWHHDASAFGDSPGVPGYMARQLDGGDAGAQLWVDRRGAWTFVAAGPCYHAGAVLPGKPGNADGVGIETDHTTGEAWPAAQLASLRKGTAILLRLMGKGTGRLEFHRTVCKPVGRKSDPHGLDLDDERTAVRAMLVTVTTSSRPAPVAPATTTEGDDVLLLFKLGDSRYRMVCGDRYVYLPERIGRTWEAAGRPFTAITEAEEKLLAEQLKVEGVPT